MVKSYCRVYANLQSVLRGTGMLENFITNIKHVFQFAAYLIGNALTLTFDTCLLSQTCKFINK